MLAQLKNFWKRCAPPELRSLPRLGAAVARYGVRDPDMERTDTVPTD